MESTLQDVRVTLRRLAKAPAFTLAAVLTIGLGIGLNTATFSAVHATLLAPLPYPDPDRLAFIWADLLTSDYPRAPLSGPELVDLRRAVTLLESVGGIWPTGATLVEDGRPEALRVGMVTANFLSILGVAPIRGRLFAPDEEGPGATPTIVISGRLWQTRFGGADVLDRRVRIDGGWGLDSNTYTIVGIMPPSFEMLLPADASVPRTVDAWIPFRQDIATAPRGVSYLRTIGRLPPGVTLASAAEQVDAASRAIVGKHAEYATSTRRFYAVALHDDVVREVRPALLALQAAVGFVLLMTCANVASLMLVRTQARRGELALRAALGASRGGLVRLLLTESVALAVVGAACGLGLAWGSLRILVVLDLGDLPRTTPTALGTPALAFSALAALLAALLFSLAPLFAASRINLVDVLKAGSRDGTAGAPQRARSALVLVEVGLGVVLLIGASLLVRTFLNLQRVEAGYDGQHVLTLHLSLPFERYGDPRMLAQFTRDLERELRALPGVQAAGAVNQLPLDDAPNWSTPYWTRATDGRGSPPEADARLVTPGYFSAVQARLSAGRWFTAQDDETQGLALIVDERLARTAWPNEAALGKELAVLVAAGGEFGVRWGHVVGVVRHLRHQRLSAEVREQVYVPFAQAPRNQMAVVVRAPVDVQGLMRAVTRQIARIDADLAVARMRPLGDFLARARAPARFSMLLACVFAGFALMLACLGLYGLVSYSVALRQAEMGVRAVLGASPVALVTLVVGQGAGVIAAGIVLGLLTAFGTGRALQSLLYGVTPFDGITFVTMPLVLGACGVLACCLPAWRAGRVAPARALRSQ